MRLSPLFLLNSVLFGVGLAMDAFSVSLANGLYAPDMRASRMLRIAGTFGVFQTAMPLLGWVCVRAIAEAFRTFQRFIPWIALALLLYIGGKMIHEGLHGAGETKEPSHGWDLFMQGVATSIDALSVGFTIRPSSAGSYWCSSALKYSRPGCGDDPFRRPFFCTLLRAT